MQLSELQQNILNTVETTNENISISGVAGCGKSTTLQLIAEVLRKANPDASILYLAFNNEICSSIEPKLLPYNVNVLTFHKWGNRSMKHKKVIRGSKYRDRVQKYFDREENPFESLTVSHVVKICDIIRTWYIPVDFKSVADAMLHHQIDMTESWYNNHFEPLVNYVKELITWGMNEQYTIDFTDMLVHPIRHRIPLLHSEIILVDESQDLSPIMHKMIKHALGKGSRVINVGDRKQAINSFAGAMYDSFDQLKEITKAVELPLSICYRCGDPIIELAKKYVPEIQGTGKPGTVEKLRISEMFARIQPSDMVICRRNAPLVTLAFRLLATGIRCIIKGRTFSDYLLHYVKKVERTNSDFNEFVSTLRSIVNEMESKTQDEDKREQLNDVFECLKTIYENSEVQDFAGIKKLVDNLFSETLESGAVTLSSFHRSKGLENDTVWLLLDKPLAKPSSDPKDQESNLAYVAITRAKKNLYMVDFGPNAKKEMRKAM